MINGNPEYKAFRAEDEDLPIRYMTLPDGFPIMVVPIPDVNSTIIFSYSDEQPVPTELNDRKLPPGVYWRVGVFTGPIPEVSDPNREAFHERAKEITKSGQAFLTEALIKRIKQLIRDEQMYARVNPRSQSR